MPEIIVYNKLGRCIMERTYTIEELRAVLFPVFLTYAVYRAVLFGSYSRGEATASSDIDILIDSKGELVNIGFYGLLEDITRKLGKSVDLLELSELQSGSPIARAIQREGVVLYEKER